MSNTPESRLLRPAVSGPADPLDAFIERCREAIRSEGRSSLELLAESCDGFIALCEEHPDIPRRLRERIAAERRAGTEEERHEREFEESHGYLHPDYADAPPDLPDGEGAFEPAAPESDAFLDISGSSLRLFPELADDASPAEMLEYLFNTKHPALAGRREYILSQLEASWDEYDIASYFKHVAQYISREYGEPGEYYPFSPAASPEEAPELKDPMYETVTRGNARMRVMFDPEEFSGEEDARRYTQVMRMGYVALGHYSSRFLFAPQKETAAGFFRALSEDIIRNVPTKNVRAMRGMPLPETTQDVIRSFGDGETLRWILDHIHLQVEAHEREAAPWGYVEKDGAELDAPGTEKLLRQSLSSAAAIRGAGELAAARASLKRAAARESAEFYRGGPHGSGFSLFDPDDDDGRGTPPSPGKAGGNAPHWMESGRAYRGGEDRPAFAGLRGADPWDLFLHLPTPCFILDEERIRQNCELLRGIAERSGCRLLLAQKAFSNYDLYPMMAPYLSGTTASGLYEARLGREELPSKEVHVYSPAYRPGEIDEILGYADHIVFNSHHELRSYAKRAHDAGLSVGLRVNPECSTQSQGSPYDPCAPHSRLGMTRGNFDRTVDRDLLRYIDGLHIHTLCEQNSDALELTLAALEEKFGDILRRVKWVNLGGGHLITKPGYDIERFERCVRHLRETYGVEVYAEPGEAWVYNAGYFASRVLDVIDDGLDCIAVLDASAACHTPDVIEMPYKPPMYNESEDGGPVRCRFGGCSCLAADSFGKYDLKVKPGIGELVLFGDMAQYTTCKTNTFNGIPLPSIYLLRGDGSIDTLAEFGYDDFRERLGSRKSK